MNKKNICIACAIVLAISDLSAPSEIATAKKIRTNITSESELSKISKPVSHNSTGTGIFIEDKIPTSSAVTKKPVATSSAVLVKPSQVKKPVATDSAVLVKPSQVKKPVATGSAVLVKPSQVKKPVATGSAVLVKPSQVKKPVATGSAVLVKPSQVKKPVATGSAVLKNKPRKHAKAYVLSSVSNNINDMNTHRNITNPDNNSGNYNSFNASLPEADSDNKAETVSPISEILSQNSSSILTAMKNEANSSDNHPNFELSSTDSNLLVGDYKDIHISNLGDNDNVSFKSTDTSILTVSQLDANTIRCTGVGTGNAYLEVRIRKKGTFFFMAPTVRLDCSFSVTPKAVSIRFRKKKYKLVTGSTKNLKLSLKPSISKETPMFISSNTSVATVSTSGKITAISPGRTYIKATLSNGNVAECKIIVR